MKSMEAQKSGVSRIILAALVTLTAIAVISLTIGQDIYEGRSQSLASFSLIHFSGYLFFLLMPVEMAFVYYLNWYDDFTLIWTALITATVAQVIDYLIGYSINSKSITRVVSEKKIMKAEGYIRKYSNLTIFAFNFLPLSSPIIALAAGILKFSLKDLLIFSITGLALKYFVLSLIAGYLI